MTGAGDGTGNGTGDEGEDRVENEEFELWRQDDNGNRVLMSRHPDRASADAALAAMEAGVQHKQLYFVRGVTPRRSSSG